MSNPVSVGQDGGSVSKLLVRLVGWAGVLACAAGGLLWALSPIGVHLSELKFHTPNVFWKLFWPAPLLILLGLVGLQAWQAGRPGPLRKAGLVVAALGLVMVMAGDIGLYWLRIDDVFIVAAPSYRAFRIGLLAFAAGSILFAVGARRRAAAVGRPAARHRVARGSGRLRRGPGPARGVPLDTFRTRVGVVGPLPPRGGDRLARHRARNRQARRWRGSSERSREGMSG